MSEHPLIAAFDTITKHLIERNILVLEEGGYVQRAYLYAVREWLYELPEEIRKALP